MEVEQNGAILLKEREKGKKNVDFPVKDQQLEESKESKEAP